MRASIRGILVTFVILPSVLQAQETRPACGTEWFVMNQGARISAREKVSLLGLDPETGKQVTLAEWGDRPGNTKRLMIVNSRGVAIRLCATHVSVASPDKSSWKAEGESHLALDRIIRETNFASIGSVALSPDGSKIALFDYLRRTLVIGDAAEVHTIPGDHCVMNPFSWSPRSEQVAFYFTDCADGDDPAVFRHGVAMVATDGKLRELVPLSQAVATPELFAKFIPPGWDPDGRHLYFTNGVPIEKDPPIHKTAGYSAAATYRVDVHTGKREFLAHGAFADISPDGRYVLLYPCPKLIDEGRWTLGTGKLDMETRRLSYLPDRIRSPRISPTGHLVAYLDEGVAFCRTSDWEPYGQPCQALKPDGEVWARLFHWITTE